MVHPNIEYCVAVKNNEASLSIFLCGDLQKILLNEKQGADHCVWYVNFCVKGKNTKIYTPLPSFSK